MTPEQIAVAMPQIEAHLAIGLLAFPAKQVADTKVPAYAGWQTKRWDVGMLEAELRKVPYYGLTQPRDDPRRLVVIDLDDGRAGLQPGQEPWQERWKRIEPIPKTKVTSTPSGGAHAWFVWPDEAPMPGATWHGFTVRKLHGAKNWAAGPGSVRPDGRPYQDVHPGQPIATMPLDLARSGQPSKLTNGHADDAPELLTTRDEILSFAGRLRFAGAVSSDIATALLARLADGRIYPSDPARPWTRGELADIAADIGGKPRGPSWTPPITISGTSQLGDDDLVGETVPASIGTRTALDLRHGTPPAQLVDPFLTPEGPTVIYARGGTGKGLIACWLVCQLVATGHVVMIVDFEGHEREWGSRLRGLGLTDEELSRVHYRAPFGADWTAPTGALATVAALVGEDADRLGVTYLVVDSYSVATSNGDTMGGEAAAREYFSGLATIGLPSTTIAHVRGDSGKFPDRPFGSVFVHNLARETWALERLGDNPDEMPDPDEIRFGPHVVSLELRNKKANARPTSPARFITFSFFADGTIEVTTDRPSGRSVADLAADALADEPLTLSKLVAAIKEDTGQVVSEDALRVTLKRYPRRFEQSTSGRPRTWAVR